MSDTSHFDDAAGAQRRTSPRVPGPFNGTWLGSVDMPLRIQDLSIGGCLIHAHHEVPRGRKFSLEIELPGMGKIRVQAEALYIRPDYGFAVRFVDVSDEDRERIDALVQRRLTQSPSEY